VGVSIFPAIQSDVTANAYLVNSVPSTQAATFTLTSLQHFRADQGTFGLNSVVSQQIGFSVGSSLTGATQNIAFYGDIAAGTSRWNYYANGTAPNYFAGQTTVGSTSIVLGAPTSSVAQQFGVVSTSATNIATVIRGASAQTGDLTQWQNSAGSVLGVITSAGRFAIGSTTTTSTLSGAIPGIQANGIGGSDSAILASRFSADTSGPSIYLNKSRSATIGTQAALSSGDRVGNIYFAGSDGTNSLNTATVLGEVDGAVSTGITPGRLVFFTQSTAGSATERLRIDSAGNILVGSIAAATSSAKTVHMANATVPTANPTGGGILYVESGALKYRGSSGTITTLGAA